MESSGFAWGRGEIIVFALALLGAGSGGGCGGGASGSPASTMSLGGGLGGGGGSGGAALDACASPAPGALDMIDDMEDGDDGTLVKPGRMGYWFTYDDGSAGLLNPAPMTQVAMEPIPGGRCGTSHKAMRITGSGFMTWGCGMGFLLNLGAGDNPALYDASATKGITFWARVGDLSVKQLKLLIGDQWTSPVGGHCDASVSSGPTACYDAFYAPLDLTATWQRFSFTWGELRQRMFGLQRDALDTTTLTTINFEVGASASVFDVWIDDVAFFE